MRILQLTAGAGGMYCGSCLRDNALAWRLDALEAPTRARLLGMYRETADLLGTSLDEICGRAVE